MATQMSSNIYDRVFYTGFIKSISYQDIDFTVGVFAISDADYFKCVGKLLLPLHTKIRIQGEWQSLARFGTRFFIYDFDVCGAEAYETP